MLPLLLAGYFSVVIAQSSLSGTPNVYERLLSQDNCLNTITVNDAGEFSPGMGLILIQMSGAQINLSDSDNYGDITALNGAGNYEYNRILDISDNELTLEFSLLHDYDVNHSQVVGFLIYEDANVDGLLQPQAWNGTTGGVLAIEVEGTLSLNADIDASGTGFRGGAPISINDNNCSFLTNANDYAYEADNWRGAPKGEGIGTAAPSAPHGRGAQANGGGGGNDHNSGGGGGGLLTAGGVGGINNEPSTFGCDGDFPGRGGKALDNSGVLLFMGGGGGSGHANNSTPSGGGNGGGIIIIKAGSIAFNGGTIRNDGQASTSISGDGGGGGGAAGSIVLLATNLLGSPAVTATGGIGASVNNNNQERCFGPGGGGSGGAIWTNQMLAVDLSGGLAGQSTNSASCSLGSNGATAGAEGLNTEIDDWPQGIPYAAPAIIEQSTDTTICAEMFTELIVTTSGNNLSFQWQRLVNGAWEDLVEVPGVITGTQTAILTLLGDMSTEGEYRLVVQDVENCFAEFSSFPIQVDIQLAPTAIPVFNIVENTVSFTGNISNASAIEWIFEPGQTSSETDPSYTFSGPGTYPVTLIVSNNCGEEQYALSVTIVEALVAALNTSSTEGCAPFTVIFEDQTEGTVSNRIWTFPGGDPSTSTAINPVVTFAEPGTYEVELEVSNDNTSASTSVSIQVVEPPVPAFNVSTDQLTITLQNTSTNASSFVWNFGDGNTSTEENPIYTYTTPGTYELSLNASNEFCAVAIAQTITVVVTSTEEITNARIRVFPNPAQTILHIENWTKEPIFLYNLQGQLVQSWMVPSPQLELKNIARGSYIIALPGAIGTVYQLLVVQ